MARRRRTTSSFGFALVLACSLISASGSTAAADPETWEPTTEIVQSVSLSDVDCVSKSVCFAVGVHHYAEVYTDEIGDVFRTTADRPLVVRRTAAGWQEVRFPAIPQEHRQGDLFVNGAASEIFCASATYCVAIGQYTTHFPRGDGIDDDNGPMTAVWNGSAWRLVQRPVEGCFGGCYEERHHVQCVAAKTCYSLSRNIRAQSNDRLGSWDGRRWTHEKVPGIRAWGQPLSCWAVRRCVAVSSWVATENPRRFRTGAHLIRGEKWSFGRLPGHHLYVGGISCRAESTCVAVADNISLFGDPRAGTWRRVPMRGNRSFFSDVSCVGSRCLAVGSAEVGSTVRAAQTFDGRVWSSATPPTPDDVRGWLSHVDCARSDLCFAAGQAYGQPEDELLLQWNGDAWRYVPLTIRPYHPPI